VSDGPNPVDINVGSRVRLRRNMLGLSQEQLGSALGVTFQQVQKYERGANRIGASRLFEIARVLDVPIAFFFDDVDPVRAPAIADDVGTPAPMLLADLLRHPEALELVRAYLDIPDPKLRRHVLELAKTVCKAANDATAIAAASARRGVTQQPRRLRRSVG